MRNSTLDNLLNLLIDSFIDTGKIYDITENDCSKEEYIYFSVTVEWECKPVIYNDTKYYLYISTPDFCSVNCNECDEIPYYFDDKYIKDGSYIEIYNDEQSIYHIEMNELSDNIIRMIYDKIKDLVCDYNNP